jgi:predicted cupin superfamily sugar epimerase
VTAPTADELVKQLDLARHPEGGWYRETYRSGEFVTASALPGRFGGPRSFSTSIYFLLEKGDISALHRIKSDEIWHFYGGAPLTLHAFTLQGDHLELKLGPDLAAGDSFQIVVPAGCWFGAELSGPGEYSLVGCTVAPGFDFADFQLGNRRDLQHLIPRYKEIINRLTRVVVTESDPDMRHS